MLAPAFLLGLLAIGLPLWLHRIARENRIRQPFASVMLLEQSELQNSAHRQLRYWLLLALRILLLAALAFAFAQPLLPPKVAQSTTTRGELHAIVLDASLSMQYGQRWQRAMQTVDNILNGLRAGDWVMLVSAAGRKFEVLHQPVSAANVEVVRPALKSVEPNLARLDYGTLMRTAESWLGVHHLPARLHLITDLQQSASPLRFADLAPPANTRLEIHDVDPEGRASNVYVKEVILASTDRRTVEVIVASTDGTAKREVSLMLNGREIARKGVDLSSAARPNTEPAVEGANASRESEPQTLMVADRTVQTRVNFGPLELPPGSHRAEVSLSPADTLPHDDRAYAVIENSNLRILLVARDTNADDMIYFAAAVNSLRAPVLQVERSSSDALDTRDLSPYAALVIADTGILSTAGINAVRRYVESGGAVFATVGIRAAGQSSDPLSGNSIGNTIERAARVSTVEDSHPVLRESEDWRGIRFFRHVALKVADDDRVLMRLEDGAPLLFERTLGAGRILTLTAPLDREWNDLAIHPLFVRFIQDAARYLAGDDAQATSVRIGGSVNTGLSAQVGGQIFDPQGKRVFGLGESAAAAQLSPDQVGFYEVRRANGSRWIAANIDAREANLERLPAEMVERWRGLKPSEPARVNAKDQQTPEAASVDERAAERSLGRWLLFLLAALAFVEVLMANYHLSVRREVPT